MSNKKSRKKCDLPFCDSRKKTKKCSTCTNVLCHDCFEKQCKANFRWNGMCFESQCPFCRSSIQIPQGILNRMKRELFSFLAQLIHQDNMEYLDSVFHRYPRYAHLTGCDSCDNNCKNTLLHIAAKADAARGGDLGMIDFLIHRGCCMRKKNITGATFYELLSFSSFNTGHRVGYTEGYEQGVQGVQQDMLHTMFNESE